MFPPHTSACVFSNISQRSCWCQLASSLCLSQCLLITHLEQGLSALRDDLITQAEIYKLAQELKALDLPQNCDLEPKGHIHTIQTSCVPAPLTLCLCSCSTPAPRWGSMPVPASHGCCSSSTSSQPSCRGTSSAAWAPCCWTTAWLCVRRQRVPSGKLRSAFGTTVRDSWCGKK